MSRAVRRACASLGSPCNGDTRLHRLIQFGFGNWLSPAVPSTSLAVSSKGTPRRSQCRIFFPGVTSARESVCLLLAAPYPSMAPSQTPHSLPSGASPALGTTRGSVSRTAGRLHPELSARTSPLHCRAVRRCLSSGAFPVFVANHGNDDHLRSRGAMSCRVFLGSHVAMLHFSAVLVLVSPACTHANRGGSTIPTSSPDSQDKSDSTYAKCRFRVSAVGCPKHTPVLRS